MEELQTINEIINDSIRDSSYISVIISSCVFILYTLIIRLVEYFKAKSKDKPLLEMSKAMQEMGNNIAKLNTVLNKTLEDTERKEIRQCDKAIQLSFRAMGFKLSQDCISIITHNNIDANKELIGENINKMVSTEYYNLYSSLSIYEVHEVNVASKLKEEWITEIANTLMLIIYNGQDSLTRISQLNNRLTLILSEYSSYVNNKVFN